MNKVIFLLLFTILLSFENKLPLNVKQITNSSRDINSMIGIMVHFQIEEEDEDICFALVFSSGEVNIFGCTDEYDDDYDPEALIDDGSCVLDIANEFIPDMFDLSDNYPNPFNPVTEFKYSVPEMADVNISVFDITGKKVTTLFNGSKKPGVYTVTWNGDGVSTGMYLTIMKAGDKVFTRKMMLIK